MTTQYLPGDQPEPQVEQPDVDAPDTEDEGSDELASPAEPPAE